MGQVVRVLKEALIVLVAGAAVALAANFLSPRGLALTRNYFPGATRPLTLASTNHPPSTITTNAIFVSPEAAIVARLKEKGLQVVNSNEVIRLFRDPRHQQELVIFVDARDDQHYQEGHIPGAYQLDHYHPESYLATVLPACQTAEQIVVYCHGGDCEDSEFTALTLRSAGIPDDKLFVYPGGITEWETNGGPVELGVRNSGNLRETKQ